jgi:hypothetical protein
VARGASETVIVMIDVEQLPLGSKRPL